ncbi:nucleotide exchange factor GrpE [Flindersiella endophytica]
MTNGGTPPFGSDSEQQQQTGPVIRDNRKIDPETGEVRQRAQESAPSPDDDAAAGAPSEPQAEEAATNVGQAEIDDLKQQLADRTLDLQRLQAEYINYKRRVDRDRQAVRDLAVASVLTDLLPVIDDIGRAREHGELEGGFKAVAESFEASLNKLGLERFGEVGEAFDPHVHEALMHSYSDEVQVASVSHLLQPGYRLGERVLRPARVAVAEPTEGLPPQPAADTDEPQDAAQQSAQPGESDAQPDTGEQG